MKGTIGAGLSHTFFGGLCRLHAGQPINGDGTAGGVAPELDELLDGEDTSEVLDASAILSMTAF